MRGRTMARNRQARRQKATPAGETAASLPAQDPSRFASILRSPWLLAIPLVLAVAVYVRVLNGQFQWDDVGSITQNLAIKDLRSYAAGFLPSLFHSGRPVTELTFAANYAIGRLDPFSYHLVNVAIHLCAVLLVYFFTRTVLRLAGAAQAGPVALVVSGLFALHPLQTQAVTYVVQRAESLASVFYLATILLLLAAERNGRTVRGALAYAGAAAALFLGLGTKVIIVTVPVAYLLLVGMVPDQSGRRSLTTWSRRAMMFAPGVVVVAFFAITTLRSLSGLAYAGFGIPDLSSEMYFATELRVWVTYLRLLVWPAGQNVDWYYLVSTGLADPAAIRAGLFLAALLGAVGGLFLHCRRRDDALGAAGRVAAFGVLWFFLVLSPTSSFVPLMDVIAEHRVYLPSWGIFAAACVLGERWLAGLRSDRARVMAAVLVGVLWVALATTTFQRNAVWQTRLSLWRDSIEKSPRFWRPHMNVAFAYQELGDHENALREYRLAYDLGGKILPGTAAILLNNIASVLASSGRIHEAIESLRRAFEIDPRSAETATNIAAAMVGTGDMPGAEEWANRAIALQPGNPRALGLLGLVKGARGDIDGALEIQRRAVAADPDSAELLFNLGKFHALAGHDAEACQALRRAAAAPAPVAAWHENIVAALNQSGCGAP